MRPPSIWKTLGLSRTQDRTEIRRAYAKQLKVTNPEDNPEGFKVLRTAYEQALGYADNRYVPNVPVEPFAQPARTVAGRDPPVPADVTTLPQPEEPSAPEVDEVAHAYFAAFARLERQLRPKTGASDDDRKASLDAILSSPMLDNIEVRVNAEQGLAQIVSRSQPQSDVLIPRLVERFGWNNRHIDRHRAHAVSQVLQREKDLAFLRFIKRSGNIHTDAWRILSQSPKAPSLWRRLWPKVSGSDILSFLNRVRNQHPTLLNDLNEEAVRTWEARALTRDLFDHIRVCALVLLPFAVIAALYTLINWGPFFGLIAILMAYPATSVALAYAYEHGFHRARTRWEESWRLQQKSLLAFGWGPTLMITLCLAAAPPSPWLTGLIGLMSIAVVWWAAVTGEVDKNRQSGPWQLHVILAELFLLLWWICAFWDFPADAAIQMTPVVLAALLVSGFGRLPLFRRWLRLGVWVQRATLLVIIAGIAGADALLWHGYALDEWKATAFACAAAMILLHRVPTMASAHWIAGFRNTVGFGALTVARIGGGAEGSLAFAGSALLALAAINCVLALFHTWRSQDTE